MSNFTTEVGSSQEE